jgi:hypothetical protein
MGVVANYGLRLPKKSTSEAFQKIAECFRERFAGLGLAFPNHEYVPPESLESSPVFSVPGFIALELRPPVAQVRLRHAGNFVCRILMLVPEAAVRENYLPEPGKYHIRTARELLHMQPVPVPHPMHEAADGEFWLHVSAADPPHVFAAPLRG